MAIDDLEEFPIGEFDELDRTTVRDRLSQNTSKKGNVLTPDEYQNQFVDFYSQTLGATGIDAGEDDEDDDDVQKETYTAPNIIPDSGDSETNLNILDINYDIGNVVNMDLPSTYEDHLASIGMDDKSDLSKLQKSFSKVNDKLTKNFGVGIDAPSKKQLKTYTSVTGLGKVFGMGGLPMTMVASMVAGKSQKNIFGVEEFKPSGIPGVVQDISESMRLGSYNKNKAKYAELKNIYNSGFGANISGSFEDYAKTQDFGYSANSKNAGSAIYRDHGSKIYNGAGMIGLDQEAARRIEALNKGLRPFGFDPTNPGDSEALVGTGKTGYDEFGYHHTRRGSAATGTEKDAKALGAEYGLDLDETKNILADVRRRRSMFGRTIEGKTLTQMLQDKQKEKAVAKEREEKARQERINRQKKELEKRQAADRARQQQEQARKNQEAATRDTSQGRIEYQDDSSSDFDSGGVGQGGDEYGGLDFASGGRVGMRDGGNTTEVVQPAGFISPDANATDQQEIADDKPMDAKDGDFIINAPAAEDAGKQDIQRMINVAITNLQEKGVDVRFGNPKINIGDKVKLLVSRNEVYIPAIIAKEIGYDRLKKINNRGKREVQRRQEESQQDEKPQARGFIQKKKGDVIRSADYSEGGIDSSRAMILRLTGHLRNIEEGLGEGFKYGKKSKEGDTLRHILTSGYISEDGFFNKFMSDAFDSREMGDNMSEEDKIDLNNNKFGRLLRQKYPDRLEFTKQARKVVDNMIKGKKTEIDGVSPMLSVRAE
jgi:hypothetical protein